MGLITFMLQQAEGEIYLAKCNPHIKGPPLFVAGSKENSAAFG